MRYDIIAVPRFRKDLKKLSRKYPFLRLDLKALFENLEVNPQMGVYLGKNCYKIRMSVSSKGKGKSAGARVITHFALSQETVYLLSIYDKSDKENLSDKELKELLGDVPE